MNENDATRTEREPIISGAHIPALYALIQQGAAMKSAEAKLEMVAGDAYEDAREEAQRRARMKPNLTPLDAVVQLTREVAKGRFPAVSNPQKDATKETR
jgi:hypothetical protein